MLSNLAALLVDPVTALPLRLVMNDSESRDGLLISPGGNEYPVDDGIPRFVTETDDEQGQTADSFGFKWKKRESWDSDPMRESTSMWLLERYGFTTAAEMREHFESRGRVVDLGCGGGFSSSLWMEGWRGEIWVGVDISAAVGVARDRLGHLPRTFFVQADILHLPFPPNTFGAVFAEGVFHHTPSTSAAIGSAARVLKHGGEMLFYVYRRKGPVREFSDDHIRAQIAAMPPSQAWEALRPITKLAQELSRLGVEVDVPEDVPFLEIPAGRYDIQRLLYWHFAKLFWNEAFTFEENIHVNFDWYHPRFAHRQSEEEVRGWCSEFGLEVTRLHVDPSGYTVRATKR